MEGDWTTEQPTLEGWYWFKYPTWEKPHIVKVYPVRNSGLWVCEAFTGKRVKLTAGDYDGALWQGPVLLPQSPARDEGDSVIERIKSAKSLLMHKWGAPMSGAEQAVIANLNYAIEKLEAKAAPSQIAGEGNT